MQRQQAEENCLVLRLIYPKTLKALPTVEQWHSCDAQSLMMGYNEYQDL